MNEPPASCRACGRPLRAGSRFCTGCGVPAAPSLPLEPTLAIPPSPPASPPASWPPPTPPAAAEPTAPTLIAQARTMFGESGQPATVAPSAPTLLGPSPAAPSAHRAVAHSIAQPPPAGPTSQPPATWLPGVSGAAAPASLLRRALAVVIDGLVAVGVFFLAGMIIGARTGDATASGFDLSGVPALIVFGILSVALPLYYVLMEWLLGGTLGKLAMSIRVEGVAGGRPAAGAALLRNLLRLVDGILLYLVGFVIALTNPRRQRLGDIAAGTVVVRRARSGSLQAIALAAAVAIAAGGVALGLVLRGPLERSSSADIVIAAILRRDGTADGVSTFRADDRAIVAAFEVTQVRGSGTLTGVWVAVDVGQAAARNTTIDQADVAITRPDRGTFRLVRGPRPFPAGDYKLDIFFEGELVESLPFKVAN